MGNRVPAAQHALRRHDMEFPRASVRIEPCPFDRAGLHGNALRSLAAVEAPEPGDGGLADFTLAVVEHASAISHDALSLQLGGEGGWPEAVLNFRHGPG